MRVKLTEKALNPAPPPSPKPAAPPATAAAVWRRATIGTLGGEGRKTGRPALGSADTAGGVAVLRSTREIESEFERQISNLIARMEVIRKFQ